MNTRVLDDRVKTELDVIHAKGRRGESQNPAGPNDVVQMEHQLAASCWQLWMSTPSAKKLRFFATPMS